MASDTGKLKQLTLSGLVILTFIAYSANQRGEKPDKPVAAPAPKPPASQTVSRGAGAVAVSKTVSYKDGAYTGSVTDAFYGDIQVQAVVSDGKLTDVKFLQYPRDNQNSISINEQAIPYLKQEAIAAQGSRVDVVSGATDTSYAFRQSLSAALAKAQ